jgi:hypothetical protein
MQRLQAFRLLMVCGVVAVAACSQDNKGGKVLSVAEYLHDLDAAKAMVKQAGTDPVKYQTDPAALNASAAVAKAMSPSMLQCWPTKPASTATTDHACLDGKGFKR